MGGFFVKRIKKGVVFLLESLIFIVLIFATLFLGIFIYYGRDLPTPEFLEEITFSQASKVFDRTGQILLYEFFNEERRIFVSLDKVSPNLKEAILTAEDINFYSHWGIDLLAVGRALLEDLKIKKLTYGGSTISQQLARTLFLSLEKTPQRKVREALLALRLDFSYPKEKIFEWYLNTVPLGGNFYGVEAAAQGYFGKRASDLSLSEAATLAAMIKAPSFYSPWKEETKKRLLERRDYILDLMVKKGKISQQAAEEAKKEQIKFLPQRTGILAPYFSFFVKSELEKMKGKDFLQKNALKIYTTLDFDIQKIVEEELKKGIEKNKKFNAYNGGAIVIDSQTGDILAMAVGNSDYFSEPEPKGCQPGVNCKFDPMVNVVLSLRQPGSALKPFVYATAFENGYSDDTVVFDEPQCFGEWGGKSYCPTNYTGQYYGEVTLRQALANSLNVSSVYVFVNLAGMQPSVDLMKKCGIEIKPPIVPSIVLGGKEVSLLDLTAGYSCFANGGERVKPQAILKIEDALGQPIFERKVQKERVLPKGVADLVSDILSDNEARSLVFGATSPLYFKDKKVSVKTGTSSDFKDTWTVGFYKNILVGVWTGNNNGEPIRKKPGVEIAAPIFHNIMERIVAQKNL